jgi:hypothetical protein
MVALMAVAALYWGIKKEREANSAKPKPEKKRKSIGQVDAEIEDLVNSAQ